MFTTRKRLVSREESKGKTPPTHAVMSGGVKLYNVQLFSAHWDIEKDATKVNRLFRFCKCTGPIVVSGMRTDLRRYVTHNNNNNIRFPVGPREEYSEVYNNNKMDAAFNQN